MPNTVRANTNATIIMIGERMAQFIKMGRLPQKPDQFVKSQPK